MNANEEMIAYSRYKQIGDENVYLMEKVRQQQAEIEALKGLIEVMRMGQPNIDYDKELLKPTFVGRELTDKEILGCWVEEFTGNALPSIDFARAILRKAQEK